MRDLFGNEISQKPVRINIYADEVYGKECPYSKNIWHYIGIVIENLETPLIDDIIRIRFLGNFDKESPYYHKNNKIVHWSEIHTADTKNISKRWLEYILDPNQSRKTYYSYILGLNDNYLDKEEFDIENEFNSKYNRFFRSAVLYAIRVFFNGSRIKVKNIYHEDGQQRYCNYFPWHIIHKLNNEEKNIEFCCKDITFLPKDHKKDPRSNIIQLCDVVLGVSTSIIHGFNESKASVYRKELADLYFDMFQRIINNPNNKNSQFEYSNRIMIRFFPKQKTDPCTIDRSKNQFYTRRKLAYAEQKSHQLTLRF